MSATAPADSFVNWENPHVHPLDLTPDGTRLLAVNTPDNRLEVFDVGAGTAIRLASIPVGLDPVSVRARNNTEAWVVNHVSDSISIVNLTTRNVIATLDTDDEPADVVFAGNPERAFVSCSQANEVLVFDPNNLTATTVELAIDAEDPRAMAVSPDGTTVYVAIFESGNRSTILGGGSAAPGFFPPNVVSDPLGPYGGVNPPPNSGEDFDPPLNPENPLPPPVGLIVKKNPEDLWMDDNGGDWTDLVSGTNAALSGRPVGWDLPDYDVAILDTASLNVSYATGVMNICMALAVNPATGKVTVVGTDATNEIRFEPNLNGRFLRVNLGIVDPDQPNPPTLVDLNPHLIYTAPTIPQVQRDLSIGDPRGIVWNAAGTRGYVTGMGSNNLVIVDATGSRAGLQPTVVVGEGPTGVVLDQARNRLYVLNKFEASISVVDTVLETELSRVSFYDPSPAAIKAGRKHLYDTHETSGLGHVACASCHVDARMDRMAWDLGNPAGEVKVFAQNCNFGLDLLGPGPCPDWHPMKGPMVTQTLQDIIGKEPHHWRGDRDGLEEFNQTFTNLQGDDDMLTPEEMQQFEDFLATITFPPNPFRTLSNDFVSPLPLPGQFTTGIDGPPGQPLPDGFPGIGVVLFMEDSIAPGPLGCVTCHTTQAGVGTNLFFVGNNGEPLPEGPNGELHHAVIFSPLSETPNLSFKIPQLRNLHEKIGFEMTQTTSRAGFGFLHDGSVDSLARFLSEPPFLQVRSDGLVANMVAFLMVFSGSNLQQGDVSSPLEPLGPLSRDTHAGVGVQLSVDGTNNDSPEVIALLAAMISQADDEPGFEPSPQAELVAKGLQNGLQRGYTYVGGGLFQSDRAAEAINTDALRLSAAPGSELTFTVVPAGTEERIGIDRDEDGFFDRDELDACSDPADGASHPGVDVIVATLLLARSGTDTQLFWNEAGTTHEMVRGSLATLQTSGGDFAAAIEECLLDNLPQTSLVYRDPQEPEDVFFLVRASGCGTYDSNGPGQVGLRDLEIGLSAGSCSD
ncbi:MAG: beta-propeller fold lactonase family protein [Gemmatimonadales bacterium]